MKSFRSYDFSISSLLLQSKNLETGKTCCVLGLYKHKVTPHICTYPVIHGHAVLQRILLFTNNHKSTSSDGGTIYICSKTFYLNCYVISTTRCNGTIFGGYTYMQNRGHALYINCSHKFTMIMNCTYIKFIEVEFQFTKLFDQHEQALGGNNLLPIGFKMRTSPNKADCS